MIDLQKLTRFDTPTISNAIELFEVRPRNEGYMDGRIRACFPEMPPIAGYAATATMRCAFPKRRRRRLRLARRTGGALRGIAGPPIVVFQDLDDPAVAATFGEIMCTTYQLLRRGGIDHFSGAARDLDQVRRTRASPAFSNGAICSHGYSHIVDLHRTVRVGGLTIHPGDLMHADANGVTTIPLEIAGRVRRRGRGIRRGRSDCAGLPERGTPDVKGFSEARRGMMDALAALGRRVRV